VWGDIRMDIYLFEYGPEAEEYESNYPYCDDSPSHCFAIIEKKLSNNNATSQSIRTHLYNLQQSARQIWQKRKT
jgi:hypothetical protein